MSLADAEARRRAATDFDTNLVVIAGAGTGKTSLLVERALNALVGRRVPLGSMVAITFTRKAAAEMSQRLAEELEWLAAARPPPDGTAAARTWSWLSGSLGLEPAGIALAAVDLLQQLESARFGTMHGFASELLRRNPVAAGVDPGFEVDEGEAFQDEAERLWPDFLERELASGARRADLWRELLPAYTLDGIRQAALSGTSFELREARPAETSASVRPPLEALAAEAERLARVEATGMNDNMRQALDRLAGLGRAYLEAGAAALGEAAEAPEAKKLLEHLPAVGRGLERSDPPLAARVKCTARDSRKLLRRLVDTDESLSRKLAELVAPFCGEVRESLLRRGVVDFTGLLVLTRDLLRDHPAIRRREGSQLRAMLVDEFQDTDPAQYEIVFFLAEGAEGEAAEAWATRLEPGKLFIVGDPKQSIYRFRGADMEAYNRAVDHVLAQGGSRLELVSNFRSTDAVLEPLNQLFTPLIGPRSEFEPDYVAVEARRRAEPGEQAVELWFLEEALGSVSRRRRVEAEAIADFIAAQAGPGKRYALNDVALLFAAMTDASIYQRSLRQRGIPFVVDGGKVFHDRSEVVELLALLAAATDPTDQVALVAVARSPLGGVPDNELAVWAGSRGRWSLAERPPARTTPNLARCFELVREVAERARTEPPDEVVRWVLEETALLPLAAAAFEGAQRVANLRKAAARVAELARDGRLTLGDALAVLLRSAREDRPEGESPLADETVEAVRILTIHRAKGLEFPVVVVPDLARAIRSDKPEFSVSLRSVRGGEGAVVAVHAPGTAPSNAARVAAWFADQLHEEAETKRLLYVATTRACDRLILVATPPRGSAPWLEALEAWGFDPRCDEQPELLAGGRVRLLTSGPESARADVAGKEDPLFLVAARAFERAAERAREAVGPGLRSPAGLSEERQASERVESAEPSRLAPDLARAVGASLHRLLEHAFEPGAEAARAVARDEARARGLEEDDVVAEVEALVEEVACSPLRGWLLSLDVAGREVPVLYRDADGALWHGMVDLLYREDGRPVVADYKTEDPRPDPRAAAERHRPQLEVYAGGVERALGLETRPVMEVVFLRGGLRVRLA